jgi:hypothetical protein
MPAAAATGLLARTDYNSSRLATCVIRCRIGNKNDAEYHGNHRLVEIVVTLKVF